MYRSFRMFSVSDERGLRDPARIRRLDSARNSGLRVAASVTGLLALCCLALAAGGVYVKLAAPAEPPQAGWSMMGIGLFFGLMTGWMSYSFFRETSLCPLAGYLKHPGRYDFCKGLITEAHYLSDGSRGGRRMLIRGSYGDRGLFIEEFDPGPWSNAVAERGEESLKPGDDRYDQKGRRLRLPIEVWVLHETGGRLASLAGIPAATAEQLAAKAREK